MLSQEPRGPRHGHWTHRSGRVGLPGNSQTWGLERTYRDPVLWKTKIVLYNHNTVNVVRKCWLKRFLNDINNWPILSYLVSMLLISKQFKFIFWLEVSFIGYKHLYLRLQHLSYYISPFPGSWNLVTLSTNKSDDIPPPPKKNFACDAWNYRLFLLKGLCRKSSLVHASWFHTTCLR